MPFHSVQDLMLSRLASFPPLVLWFFFVSGFFIRLLCNFFNMLDNTLLHPTPILPCLWNCFYFCDFFLKVSSFSTTSPNRQSSISANSPSPPECLVKGVKGPEWCEFIETGSCALVKLPPFYPAPKKVTQDAPKAELEAGQAGGGNEVAWLGTSLFCSTNQTFGVFFSASIWLFSGKYHDPFPLIRPISVPPYRPFNPHCPL